MASPPPLPTIPGPKLAPFTTNARAEIEFLGNLGSHADKDGLVWKVKIDGRKYALKMVSTTSFGDNMWTQKRAFKR